MFEKRDQRFLRALETAEEFEKLLKQLRFGRRLYSISTAFSFLGFVVILLISLHMGGDIPPGAISLIMLMPVMLLFFPVLFLIKAISLNGEIRTLLVFQRLKSL